MPFKGKKSKNRKNKKNASEFKKILEYADEDGQTYGYVIKALGCRFFDVNCQDGITRRCKVRNKRLKTKINQYVIVSIRDFDDKNGDIIHTYDNNEVSVLMREGVLKNNMTNTETDSIFDIGDICFDDI